jgi:hypothetical protein
MNQKRGSTKREQSGTAILRVKIGTMISIITKTLRYYKEKSLETRRDRLLKKGTLITPHTVLFPHCRILYLEEKVFYKIFFGSRNDFCFVSPCHVCMCVGYFITSGLLSCVVKRAMWDVRQAYKLLLRVPRNFKQRFNQNTDGVP